MKHDEFFRKHPVFTGEELGKHLSSHGEVGRRTQEALLAYHRKAGRVVRVRRGLYAVIPAGAGAGSYPVDPFLVAAKMTADAVLSHHTALEFHGKASTSGGCPKNTPEASGRCGMKAPPAGAPTSKWTSTSCSAFRCGQ